MKWSRWAVIEHIASAWPSVATPEVKLKFLNEIDARGPSLPKLRTNNAWQNTKRLSSKLKPAFFSWANQLAFLKVCGLEVIPLSSYWTHRFCMAQRCHAGSEVKNSKRNWRACPSVANWAQNQQCIVKYKVTLRQAKPGILQLASNNNS